MGMSRMKTLWHVNYQKIPLLFAGLFNMLKSSELTDFKFYTFAFSGHAPAHAQRLGHLLDVVYLISWH